MICNHLLQQLCRFTVNPSELFNRTFNTHQCILKVKLPSNCCTVYIFWIEKWGAKSLNHSIEIREWPGTTACHLESNGWFIEGQAFSLSYDLVPPPPPPSKLDRRHIWKTEKERQLADGRGARGRKGWGRCQIIRRRESLVLFKSFNTLCATHLNCAVDTPG